MCVKCVFSINYKGIHSITVNVLLNSSHCWVIWLDARVSLLSVFSMLLLRLLGFSR